MINVVYCNRRWMQASLLMLVRCNAYPKLLVMLVWFVNCVIPVASKYKTAMRFVIMSLLIIYKYIFSMYADEAYQCGLVNKVLDTKEQLIGSYTIGQQGKRYTWNGKSNYLIQRKHSKLPSSLQANHRQPQLAQSKKKNQILPSYCIILTTCQQAFVELFS